MRGAAYRRPLDRQATIFNMPRSEEVLSIFLASPGDVAEERERMAEVVSHWNRSWSRELGLRLELLRWEEDAYPDIGEDAQDVINQQISAEWDIFVGIMWSRFGTPTNRFGSGTQEEFERALARYRSVPGSISLLMYFKDGPIAPSKIDTNQLQQVQAFRQSVAAAGLLSWDFSDADQFEKLIGLHITKHVQEWRRSKADESSVLSAGLPLTLAPREADVAASPAGSVKLPSASEAEDDDGYLDLLEEYTERSAEMGQIADRLSAAQNELTEKVNKGREELDALRAQPEVSAKQIRASISRVAQHMQKFTERVDEEAPLFRAAVDASMVTLTRLATIFAEVYPEQLEATKAAGYQLLRTLISARQSTESFRESTAGLPRMTKELNVAKRRQVAALNALISEFENGERLLAEGLTVIANLTGKKSAQ